jgi:putative ABC transport system permease protein
LEAVGYVDSSQTSRRKSKHTRKITPASIAWNNVTRNKKKVAVTVLSLSLSLILLNSVYAMVKSFDMEKYLAESTLSDFYVTHYTVADYVSIVTNYEGITPEFLEELDRQPGVKDAGSIYYKYYVDYDATPFNIYPIYSVESPILPLVTEEIAYDTLAEGNYILVTPPFMSEGPSALDYQVGDKITLKNEAEEEREFEVIGCIEEYPYPLSTGDFYRNGVTMVMAATVYTDFFGEQQPMKTNFNVEPDEMAAMEGWIADYTENVNPDLVYVSRGSLVREFEKLIRTVTLIGQLISGVLAMIGILNFINAMTTSILARRRELAMLQSIGMTGKQLKAMLYWEGIIYAAFTLGVTFTLGSGVVWVLTKAIAGATWFFSQRFTLMPSLLCAVPLFFICAASPLICWQSVKKESVVERLRVE